MELLTNRLRTWLPLLLLLLIPTLIQLPALTGSFKPDPLALVASVGDVGKHHWGNPWIDPNVGFQGQALGKLSADQWLSGQVPWWNAYNGVGLPLAAEAQPASLFLPFVLLMHFRDGGIWVKWLLQIIAGVCTFALLRRIGLTKTAALSGAALFELNGTFGWHGAPIMTPIAFLPMLLLGVEQLRGRVCVNAGGGWLLIPAALAWSIYAGFPETAYIDGLLAGVWVLSRLPGLSAPQKLKFARGIFLGVLLGVLCAAPLIVPFAELLSRAFVGAHDGSFAHAKLPYAAAAQSFMPWLYGPIAAYSDPQNVLDHVWGGIGGYITALALFLVLSSVFFCRRLLHVALLIWMGLCFAKTFDVRPISDLINLIPLIKSAAFFRYCAPSWEFAQVVLIALAIDGMQRTAPISRVRLALAFIASVAAVLLAIWLAADLIGVLLKTPSYRPFFQVAVVWLIVSMAAALLLTMRRDRWRGALKGLVVLLIIDACIAFILPVRNGVRQIERHEGGIAFLQSHVGLDRVYSLGPLAANYGAFFKVAQINYNYLPVPSNWVDYIHAHINPAADPIALIGIVGMTNEGDNPAAFRSHGPAAYEELGIRYVLTPPGTSPFTSPPSASANGSPLPPSASPLAQGTRASAHVYSGDDMEIYELPHPKPYFDVLTGSCKLWPANRNELTSNCATSAMLLRREAFYPGWRASIDGQTQSVTETNGIFQGLSLPQGNHRVVFSYRPTYMWLIAIGFIAGILGLIAGGWIEWRRFKRSGKSSGSSAAGIAH
ncbi:YfhO family protein [Rhodanobacter sp. BL-MT-08]